MSCQCGDSGDSCIVNSERGVGNTDYGVSVALLTYKHCYDVTEEG